MKYITQKHEQGIAIITWELDPYPQREEDDLGLDYCISYEVFDQNANLIKEDSIGCVQMIASESNWKEFEKELLETYKCHFC